MWEQVLNTYWQFRIWWMNNITERWLRFKFDCYERAKSTWYSLKARSWHKPCFECWGSKTSVKYNQIQPCRNGCGVGYVKIGFLHDLIFSRNWWYSFRLFIYGCAPNSKADHVCVRGTWGCVQHPKRSSLVEIKK